ncbi:transglycosylase SLT domain-containing protein [Streptomyces kunmingensis]|uniref:Transglycosylase SLT domain-containing protein n=1 Tax=Streptomyces kunmingensis TaxID=68225 RepID=A0ABU6CII4_9ACTN|nr:transglycosylase SLT domain-containing protein [Streptomyces kunmingensis]MEB3963917.1 transglycosylase SLT domain-containing protein [Streptomyces kunmingensis]
MSIALTQTTADRAARIRKVSFSGIATVGAVAAALTLVPSTAQAAPPAATSAKTTKAAATTTPAPAAKSAAPAAKTYPDNLDGWIRESLAIMKAKGIPGSYEGLHRNIMRESSGNPNAQNNWDINARNGIPSKGLLQVIQPTFDRFHVSGTVNSLTDPVANITAAANYAAHRYGSIDNVDSAY